MAIYKNQSNLKFRVDTGTDLTNATTSLINYRKPNGLTTGSFTASVVDAPNGIIEYSVSSPNELDVVGTWRIHVQITFNDGRISYGNYDTFEVIPIWAEYEDWAGFEDDPFTEKP